MGGRCRHEGLFRLHGQILPGRVTSSTTVNTYGYSTAELLVKVLQAMRRRSHARKHHEAGGQSERTSPAACRCPAWSINTSPTDYRINKQMQMMKFNGERWELFGPIIEDHRTCRRYAAGPVRVHERSRRLPSWHNAAFVFELR